MAENTEPIYDDAGNEVKPKYATEVVADSPDGLVAVLRAYCDPGPGQKLHTAAKQKLHDEWPTLALALDRLVGEELLKRLG